MASKKSPAVNPEGFHSKVSSSIWATYSLMMEGRRSIEHKIETMLIFAGILLFLYIDKNLLTTSFLSQIGVVSLGLLYLVALFALCVPRIVWIPSVDKKKFDEFKKNDDAEGLHTLLMFEVYELAGQRDIFMKKMGEYLRLCLNLLILSTTILLVETFSGRILYQIGTSFFLSISAVFLNKTFGLDIREDESLFKQIGLYGIAEKIKSFWTRKWVAGIRDWLLRVTVIVISFAGVGFGIIVSANPFETFKNFLVAGSIIGVIDLFFERWIRGILKENALEFQIFVILVILLAFAFHFSRFI